MTSTATAVAGFTTTSSSSSMSTGDFSTLTDCASFSRGGCLLGVEFSSSFVAAATGCGDESRGGGGGFVST